MPNNNFTCEDLSVHSVFCRSGVCTRRPGDGGLVPGEGVPIDQPVLDFTDARSCISTDFRGFTDCDKDIRYPPNCALAACLNIHGRALFHDGNGFLFEGHSDVCMTLREECSPLAFFNPDFIPPATYFEIGEFHSVPDYSTQVCDLSFVCLDSALCPDNDITWGNFDRDWSVDGLSWLEANFDWADGTENYEWGAVDGGGRDFFVAPIPCADATFVLDFEEILPGIVPAGAPTIVSTTCVRGSYERVDAYEQLDFTRCTNPVGPLELGIFPCYRHVVYICDG